MKNININLNIDEKENAITLKTIKSKIKNDESLTKDEKLFIENKFSGEFFENFNKMKYDIEQTFSKLNKYLNEYFNNLNKNLLDSGWFINDDVSGGSDIYKLFDENFADYYNRLLKSDTEKKEILEEIKFLYDKEKYYCAIISLYTLIDNHIYSIFCDKDESMSEFKKCKNRIPDLYYDNLMKIFENKKINTNPHTKNVVFKNGNNLLNRHSIIHGFSINFGTRENFYKVFSMYLFLDEIKTDINVNRRLKYK